VPEASNPAHTAPLTLDDEVGMRLILTMTLMLAMSGGIVLGQGTGGAPSGAAPSNPTPSAPLSSNRTGKNALDQEYADCMQLWDAKTHMSKQEWSRTCRRIQSRLDQVQIK
jgi:hypothetical protein